MSARQTILCIASYFKGNTFLERAKREGCRTILLTVEQKLQEPWAREALDEVFAVPSVEDRLAVIHAVAYLLRTREVDRIVALDDFDVELGAGLREYFRLPGLYESTARLFRDKLAMRTAAAARGVPVPEFTPVFNDRQVKAFLDRVPAPWLLKPRGSANAIGIQKLQHKDEVVRALEALADARADYLLEQMIAGDLFHVDSIVAGGQVKFAEVNKYAKPLFDVYHGGGVYMTRTVTRSNPIVHTLRRMNEQVLLGFGMDYGVSHSEYMQAHDDGRCYLIETSARVGGANIAEMVEGATGVNLWSEWAKVEIDRDPHYQPPVTRQLYGGTVISLAKQEWPDHSPFRDPEIIFRVKKKNHIGFVVAAEQPERVVELLNGYANIIARDYLAVLPAATKATD